MANHYDIPSWAGKPPVGLHLDVLKVDKLIQKLMIDEKKCYLFGRNPELNDFCINTLFPFRVLCLSLKASEQKFFGFIWEKKKGGKGSLYTAHGTYIGSIRLEPHKPTQLPVDSKFHFGASTRIYILRERPQKAGRTTSDDLEKKSEELEGGLLGLPESETELDNLTEFNTAHNRRITMLGITDEEIKPTARKRKSVSVRFSTEEEIINPEDIDPTVGRFRNLVQSAIIPNKRQREETSNLFGSGLSSNSNKRMAQSFHTVNDIHRSDSGHGTISTLFTPSLSVKLGLHLPNPAPDIDLEQTEVVPDYTVTIPNPTVPNETNISQEPKKKKYAKEAWPGKKPTPSLLI
ncbi:Nuclear inhibitor of protein phosphatase 1 like protein [Argiope bruennichi]|uniref:Nuclear inhibitor of protein phosphatase 1 like protein n=1 Tax=Argiope bruennichi TaxID=94029 RepID=A0A8T0E6V9_ARGBR|nr:Nuclear inhibitor of protein phosphatase 1 like protein [Argiope bruennichi]